jgi:HAD superfamily hydrolase (TIGR01490 family)
MMTSETYAAFFDLDLTIINVNSGSLLVREAYKKGVMSTGNLLNAILQSYLYKFNLRDTNAIISRMGTWLKGLDREIMDELSREVVNDYLADSIRPEILKEIEFHKENKAVIVMLSSAIDSICRPVAKLIGIEDIICSSMETINGILTGDPEGKFCYGDEKRVRLMEFCEAGNHKLSEAFYYADSISDLPALDIVGHPVCVTPDKKLRHLAREREWKIYDW